MLKVKTAAIRPAAFVNIYGARMAVERAINVLGYGARLGERAINVLGKVHPFRTGRKKNAVCLNMRYGQSTF
jgi:hypothetical protein